MKHKFHLILVLFVFLLFSGSSAIAQNQEPDSPTGITATVGTTFTYQGFLSESGSPANGTYNFIFVLFDALTSGGQVGGTIVKTGETVSDGYFTVELNFGDVFDGTALWLDLQVQGAGDPSYTALTPRQPLNATPYALYASDVGYHDHLWELWSGSNPSAFGLKIHNLATSGSYGGIFGETKSTTGKGIYGYASGLTGINYGVLGKSQYSPDGRGVSGRGAYGVYGETSFLNGTAIYGEAIATSGTNYGVYGESHSSSGYGGYFLNSGSDGTALYAEGDGTARNKAALRVLNTSGNGGVAAYLRNYSESATAIFSNDNIGQVLYLTNGSLWADGHDGGDFIVAVNENGTDIQFKVTTDGSVYTDGSYNCGKSFNDGPLLGFPPFPPYTIGQNEAYISPCLKDDVPADFAEMFMTTGDPEPGDVLAIGPDGNLIQSTEPYQTTVIGVHSTRPSYLGNAQFADEDGYAPLALLGVVPVKASAENGPIQPGDLLVASSTPGHAMRAGENPPQGTVLGKALEPLDEGTGFIMIVVTLQ